ncbi:MAG: GlsB/YeaQ/YmgE family stress response membrane protein [Verrucomicrobiota bacterium]
MLHILWSIIIGFIVGLIARAVMPGDQHLGFIATTLVGIVGSVVGGLIARLFSRPADGALFHPAGFFLSIVGAIVVLWALIHFGSSPVH